MIPEEILAQEQKAKAVARSIGFVPPSRFMEMGDEFAPTDYRLLASQIGIPVADIALIRDDDHFVDFPELCRAIISRRTHLS